MQLFASCRPAKRIDAPKPLSNNFYAYIQFVGAMKEVYVGWAGTGDTRQALTLGTSTTCMNVGFPAPAQVSERAFVKRPGQANPVCTRSHDTFHCPCLYVLPWSLDIERSQTAAVLTLLVLGDFLSRRRSCTQEVSQKPPESFNLHRDCDILVRHGC